MTNFRWNSPIRLLTAFAVLVLTTASWAQQRPAVVEKLAKAYGFDSYGQIDAVRYTFNLTFPGVNLSRSWTWEPKTNQVTYEGKDKSGKPVKVTYRRTELNSQPANVKDEVDPGFINDNYWFMLPFHVYWDSSATVTEQGMKKLPVGNGTAQLISVKYPNEGGYTPGDTWDLYLGKDYRIQAMVYHRGGPKKPSLVVASWAGYKKGGPLLVSTEHSGTADGNALHLTFTNVAVKLAGSNKWMNVQ